MVRKFYKLLRESPEYADYMQLPDGGFAADQKFLMAVAEKHFSVFELLQAYYEEKSIFFVDDYHLVSFLVVKFFKFMNKGFGSDDSLPVLLKTENDDVNEDLLFVKKLFRETVLNAAKYEGIIADKTPNWERERIAVMDMLILKMALAELIYFPFIPVKVSLNEYIDISKYFSTPRSRVFVNGILDKLIQDLKESGEIVKEGRGLVE